MKFYHPLTKEKSILKILAEEIRELKNDVRDSGVPYFHPKDRWPGYHEMVAENIRNQPLMQRRLSKLKRAYRDRHIAYCLVRRGHHSLRYGTGRDIESLNGRHNYDQKHINYHRLRLLTEIAIEYSAHTNKLLIDIENLKPCIAIFVSKTGQRKRLKIDDFEKKPNGDFVMECFAPGTVFNDSMEWPVNTGDTVSVLKEEYDKLPTEFKGLDEAAPIPEKLWDDITPIKTKIENYRMVRDFLEDYLGVIEYKPWTLRECWDQLPTNDQIFRVMNIYEICGKKFHKIIEIEYVKDWLDARLPWDFK